MRYLVVLMQEVLEGPDGDEDEFADAKGIDLCEDSRAVNASIVKAQRCGLDWAVFEVVPGRASAERRSVVFKMDGGVSYDVELS